MIVQKVQVLYHKFEESCKLILELQVEVQIITHIRGGLRAADGGATITILTERKWIAAVSEGEETGS